MKQACATRVRYVVKISTSTSKYSFLGLSASLAACVVVLTPCHLSLADNLPLPTWNESDNVREPSAALLPPPGDIFQGATNRPEIALPTGNFGEVPSAGNIIPPGAAGNAVSAIRNIQSSNPMGAFRSVGGAGQQGASVIPAVGQIAGSVGAGRTGLPSGMGNIAQTIQAGAQIVGAVGQIQGTLGRFQQGGSGIQNVAGMVGGVAGINQGMGGLLNQGMGSFGNQGMGSFGQGGTPSLGGILQGLRGQTGNGMFGNGMGAGPFGQFMGQNNQIMQGMQFVALLQQLFGMFFPADSAMQFNNANTGQSARTAFVNLMGANGSGAETPGFYNYSDQVGPDVEGCGGTQSFNSNVDIDTDGRGNTAPWRTERPDTSLQLGGRSLNSDRTNFIVMPNNGECQKNLGKYASVEYRGEKVYGIVADCGPAGKTGEMSTSMAKELSDKLHANGKGNGVPTFVGNGDVDHGKGFAGDGKATYTILPGSVDRSKPITNDQIRDNAMGLENQVAAQCATGNLTSGT